jgi:hypothetical protein
MILRVGQFQVPPPSARKHCSVFRYCLPSFHNLLTLGVLAAHFAQQLCVTLHSRTGLKIAPRVVTARADFIQPAHHSDSVLRFAVPDEGEDIVFRFEVNSMAFLKRSCSIFKRS